MFQERAAIREYDGGFARPHAEALALLDVVNRDPERSQQRARVRDRRR